MESRENRKSGLTLEVLNFDFGACCETTKRIVLEGVVQNKIALADVIRHSRICPTCERVVRSAIPKISLRDVGEITALLTGLSQ